MFAKKTTTAEPTIEALHHPVVAWRAAVAAADTRIERAAAAIAATEQEIAGSVEPATPAGGRLAQVRAAVRLGNETAERLAEVETEVAIELAMEQEAKRAHAARLDALRGEAEVLRAELAAARAAREALVVPRDDVLATWESFMAEVGSDVLAAAASLAAAHRRFVAIGNIARSQTSIFRYRGGALHAREDGIVPYSPPYGGDGKPTATVLGIYHGVPADQRAEFDGAFITGATDADLAAAEREIEQRGLVLLTAAERRIDEPALPQPTTIVVRPAEPAFLALR